MQTIAQFQMSTYFACILGIAISVLLPPLWAFVRKAFPSAPAGSTKFQEAVYVGWHLLSPYLALGAASALTAVLLVAFLGDKLTSVGAAILAGYAWDSTLQKLK